MSNKKIGASIRKIRKAHHETQRQLGNAVYLTESAIANYEGGFRNVPIDILMKIASHYGVTVDDLIR